MTPIMTIEDAQAAEKAARDRFERDTVAFECGDRSVTMAEARRVFEKYHPGPDWKRPVDAQVSCDDAEVFANACEFYQGSRARVTRNDQPVGVVRVTTNGYIC